MPTCKGYKRKCWLATTAEPFSQYCSACQRASDLDAFDTVLKESDWLPDTLFIERLKCVYAIRVYKQFRTRAIEKALAVLVERRNKDMLYTHVQWIINTTSIAPNLYHAVHTHSRGDLCKPFLWLLLHDKAQTFPLPASCPKCILHCALYEQHLTGPQRADLVMLLHSHRITPILATALRYTSDALQLFNKYRAEILAPSLQMTQDIWRRIFQNVFMSASRTQEEFTQWWSTPDHLLLLNSHTTLSTDTRRILKQRIESIKLDLIEKTWHPDRLMNWCLDIDDLRDIRD
jgi:hypothetical protein